MADILALDESNQLLNLCRTGRLYDVEKWIAEGKPLETHVAKNRRKQTLLQIAVETGFHSLVELLARNETSQNSKNASLQDAVSQHRLDLIELLVANGAEINSVPLVDVLLGWDPQIFRFFLDHGADPVTGSPFAIAFGEKIRTALRPYVELKRSRPELADNLQQQLDRALRHFCYEGNLKWVSLLLWAGGDPRSLGPSLEKGYTEDPECYTSGLIEACYESNVDVIKKLKPETSRDDLSNLLHCATVSGKRDALRYLLELGANPNDKEHGGSSALDSSLNHLHVFDLYGTKQLKSKYAVSKALECAEELVSHGAKWNPDRNNVNWVRRSLLECEPEVTSRFSISFANTILVPQKAYTSFFERPE